MRNIAQTAFLMAAFTLVSKLFGFVKEMIMANFYGTSYITDAFVMALAIPGMIFMGILGAVATAYMPLFSKKIETEGQEEANRFTSATINMLLLISLISIVIGITFSDQIVSIFASGFENKTAELTGDFLKVTFCYVLFTSVAGIFEGYLQYKGTYLPQIVIGYLEKVIVILAIIISIYTNYYVLVLGWLIAYGIRIVIELILVKKTSFKYIPSLKADKAVRSIMTLALPVFIGNSIAQINTFVDKTLASNLAEGSVAALNYGWLLVGLIIGVTTSIMVTLIYPKISQASAIDDHVRYNDIVSTGVVFIFIIVLPCSFGAMAYNNVIVQIVYERGAFDTIASDMTSSAFLFYSVGIVFMALNDLLTKSFYSLHDMKTPMIFAALGVIMNITLNLILVQYMAHSGLAFATSLAAIFNFILLYIGMSIKHPEIIFFKSAKKIIRIIIAAALSIGASLLFYEIVAVKIDFSIASYILQFGLAVCVAVVLYYLLLRLLKIDEIKILRDLLRRNN